ncbi:MAG: hypothetical protein A2289_26520 [Deltaproteobacteria bacterium RIFOXYA12_FULL_58_15]|nr:MAG: hypothetical protein A2289_26520 [Deltaproteobacteria bacterium RIFOXYA12_FULL_58_15]OGR07711.1 MAG: hypothetical protein A2341_06725 [Deltaproteobacteria bacterium RIFOXYB12_FULL_58_9]
MLGRLKEKGAGFVASLRRTLRDDRRPLHRRGPVSRRSRTGRGNERGVALLVVLSTLALVTAATVDLQFNSHVDVMLGFNARDGLQAEYNALSALRLRALIIKHAQRLNSAAQGLAGALGMESGAMPPIGQMLDMIPVDCGLMSAIVREVDDDWGDAEDSEDFEEGGASDVFAGECSATSESEQTKISINKLGQATAGANKQVTAFLMGLLMNPSLERHFDEDDYNGVHAEDPEELVAAIADWVDRDKNETGNLVADEDRHYSYLKDSYLPKNAPFDSVAELQLVHGVDDELYDILKPHVTVHSESTQIEISTAPDERIWLGLASCLRQGVSVVELFNHPGFVEFVRMFTEMRMLGGASFTVMKVATLVSIIETTGLGALIDTAAVNNVFTDKSVNTWYTLHAMGRVGNATRKITAVFQSAEAQFYYVRIE